MKGWEIIADNLEKAYGRGGGVGRTLGVGEHLPVHAVGVGVGVAVAVGVGLGVPTGTKVHPPLAGPPTALQKYWLKQLSSLCVPAVALRLP